MRTRDLHPGDIVEVRPAHEILATLDENGAAEGIPFMPEMLRYVGRRFTVSRRVEKICDTAGRTYRSRRMRSVVLLDDLRCDGSGHGGCQAGCRIYWKDSWLRRVEAAPAQASAHDNELLVELVTGGATVDGARDGTIIYRCQATEALAATEPIRRFDLTQYAREVRAGNVSARHVVSVLFRELYGKIVRVVSGESLPVSPRDPVQHNPRLDLEPGELVRVRSPAEIAATLGPSGMNRGLWFDREMLPFCGGTYRVKERVERFIDDASGEMVSISTDAVILEGVACGGECSTWRWFCPRGIYPFWREAWLTRVESSDEQRSKSMPLPG